MLMAYLPAAIMAVAVEPGLNIVDGSKRSDKATLDWRDYFGPDKLDTEYAGMVWTDKSVFTSATDELPGVSLKDDKNFLIALSAIASNLSIAGQTSSPTDTMLVLDVSGSMVGVKYEVGSIRESSSKYTAVKATDMSILTAMVESTNATIKKLMELNVNNRVGVVLFSGNTSTSDAATPSSATVVLPLGRYADVGGEYLSIDAPTETKSLYKKQSNKWQSIGNVTYVPEKATIKVATKGGLKTEEGKAVASTSKQVIGGTYVQNGLIKALDQFIAVRDTTVPQGRPEAGAERLPIIVLLTDGAPTVATNTYTNIGNSKYGDGTESHAAIDMITYLTQLTAAYVRGKVSEHYQEDEKDEKDVLFLTLGLGTANSTNATSTLYPAGSSDDLKEKWDSYLNTSAENALTVNIGNYEAELTRNASVAAMNYVDKYHYASDAQTLVNSFIQIIEDIQLKTTSFVTLVEGGNANFSGYVTFEDELGELMQLKEMKGLIMSDGKGGKLLYSGKEIAKSMAEGTLGIVGNSNALGEALIASIVERIPGLNAEQAQELVRSAYNDYQLYYQDENNWSNYIGWYADKDGNFVGFWDKDSGYGNAPEGAVYANRSYGYLGADGDATAMHAVVLVRTKLSDLHQTVVFKIPAALLPTVQYRITLNKDDPTKVDKFERVDATPIQLVFEVGLRSDINAINMESKIAEHVSKGGHVHRNSDGTVTFYTNEFSIGNDKNGNGVPDPEEVESAEVAESHFHPAKDNNCYYYTENTTIVDKNGTPVSSQARPTGEYYHPQYVYDQTKRTTILLPVSEQTLANDAKYDSVNEQWYVPAGTPFRDVSNFKSDKAENTTESLPYSRFPAVFENGTKQDVYTFLGNNGAITLAPAQGIAVTKTVDKVSNEENAPTEFVFTVTLDRVVEGLAFTDTDGNALDGVATVNGRFITLTLKAGHTVVITGIPTGVAYTVEEQATVYYSAAAINASGTVAAYTITPVDFINTAKDFGALVVGKDVRYPDGFLPTDAHGAKRFTIYVTFEGDVTTMVAPDGAAQVGNTFTLTLRDGENAVFSHIPEGVTYTVSEMSEEDMPDGYSLMEISYSDEKQTVDGGDVDEAAVINVYAPAPVSANIVVEGDKTLVTNEDSWGGVSFELELFRALADGSLVSTGLAATMTEAEPHYEIDMGSISFDKVGTYDFRLVEIVPEDRNQNIAYDTSVGMFSAIVTDEDADGVLEVKVVHAYQTTTVSGNSVDGWVVNKDFTNVVTTDRIYLDIQKHVVSPTTRQSVDAPLGGIPFGLFTTMDKDAKASYYGVSDAYGAASIMIPVTKDAIASTPAGKLIYYMREIAPELEDRVIGMSYDEEFKYAVAISWSEDENCAVVEYATITDGVVGEFGAITDGFTFDFTNTYEEGVSVELEFSGNKTLNGSDVGALEFSFSIYEANSAFGKGELIRTVTNKGGLIDFGSVSFTAPGVYYFVANENATTLGGIAIDSTEYHITVSVEKIIANDGTTRLEITSAYPIVVANGTTVNVGATGLDFDNVYTVTGSEDVVIEGIKTLIGRPLREGEFTIGLYEDAACTLLIESVTNKADGTFAFLPLTFTPSDLGEDYADTAYIYYVKEIAGDKGGVTYDDNVYSVTVRVSHSEGKLIVTPSDNAASLEIVNTYKAAPVDAIINGKKLLVGDWSSVRDQSFTFNLFAADSEFAITNSTPISSATVNGAENFRIALNFADGEEGYYYFVLKEDVSANAGGVGYDAGEYHVTVHVSDTGNGSLAANVSLFRPGTGDAEEAVFSNAYTVAPATVTLTGTKSFINTATNTAVPMTDGMFTFGVFEGDMLVADGKSLADGTIAFSTITYYGAGVHTYSVVEYSGSIGGVTYDTTVFTVVVTVVDNGDGTLTVTADYTTPIAFENTYMASSAQATISGEKELVGDWSAVSDADKLFTFAIYPADSAFTVNGNAISYVISGSGKFSFNTITYTAAGTYYYVVREERGTNGGIIYDGTEYRITVVVTDNGVGKLIPSVTSENECVVVAADVENENIVSIDGVKFVNSYSASSAQYTPEANKIYDRGEGEEMKEFDFILSMDGVILQNKQNDKDGKIVFDTLTFDTAGVYVLTVREEPNALYDNIRWDDNVYTVTLRVVDNGYGKLVIDEESLEITSTKGRNDLVFHNAHDDVIVEKNVFAENDPTISIDGETVNVGDVLTYVIYYTNYDSVPVSVTLIDTVPLYTEYLEGSAQGGVLDGDVITWTLGEVAAGETVSVSFKVKVTKGGVTVENGASVLEGGKQYFTNIIKNPVKAPETPPETSDASESWMWFTLLVACAGAISALAARDRKRRED